MSDTALELVLPRDRAVIVSALVLLLALAWAYVLWIAADMDMGGMDSEFRMMPAGIGIMAPALAPWSPFEFFLVFIMWASDDDRDDDSVGHTDDSCGGDRSVLPLRAVIARTNWRGTTA
jgi:hypothetical protein